MTGIRIDWMRIVLVIRGVEMGRVRVRGGEIGRAMNRGYRNCIRDRGDRWICLQRSPEWMLNITRIMTG